MAIARYKREGRKNASLRRAGSGAAPPVDASTHLLLVDLKSFTGRARFVQIKMVHREQSALVGTSVEICPDVIPSGPEVAVLCALNERLIR